MRIHATINERTLRRTFREHLNGKRNLTVLDRDLPAFGLKFSAKGKRTFFVRVVRKLGARDVVLGACDDLTAAEAREKAMAELEAAKADREAGPIMRDFAEEFMRRQGRRWKPVTRESYRGLLDRYILPFFGGMRVVEITHADVQRWFDSMSGVPGNANRTLSVLSVMMTQAELWDLRPQGSNPCRNMSRYRLKPRERFLSLDELKRLGFVLDHAGDTQGGRRDPAPAVHRGPFLGDHQPRVGLDTRHTGRPARLQDRAQGNPAPAPGQGGAARLAARGRLRVPEQQGRRADDRPRPSLAEAARVRRSGTACGSMTAATRSPVTRS